MPPNLLLDTPMPSPSTLVLNSFFDGTASGNGRVKDVCSTPDPSKYHDPSTQYTTTYGGGTLASKMPAGRNGVRGVIIPRATRNGRSQGWNPHKPPHRRVIIDPIIAGGALEMDLSLITKELAANAMQDARTIVPVVNNIDEERYQQSAYYHLLAERGCGHALNSQQAMTDAEQRDGSAPNNLTQPEQRPRLAAPVPVSQPQPAYQIKEASFGSPSPQPQATLMQDAQQPRSQPQQQYYTTPSHDPALQYPQQQAPYEPPPPGYHQNPPQLYGTPQDQGYPQQPAPPRPRFDPPQPQAYAPNPQQGYGGGNLLSAFNRPAECSPPPPAYGQAQGAPQEIRVTFGLPVGDYQAYFHGWSRGSNALVLVYDDRVRAAGRFFPNLIPDRIAVDIDGVPTVFLVELTGIKYAYEGKTHYVMIIENETDKSRVVGR